MTNEKFTFLGFGLVKNNSILSTAQDIISALKNRNPVKPIAANLNSHASFRQEEKDALRCFLSNA